MDFQMLSPRKLLVLVFMGGLVFGLTGSGCDDDEKTDTDTGQPDVVEDVVEDTVDDTGDDADDAVEEDVSVDTSEDMVLTCGEGCGDCEACELVGDTPTCVLQCTEDQTCGNGVCVRAEVHAGLSQLEGPFADGPAVTAACLGCHTSDATAFMATSHWNWFGDTPNLVGHETDSDIGKMNLINNFCVAIDSNEQRCSHCHTSYGWVDDTFDFTDNSNIDCLICHSDPASGYRRGPTDAGPAEGVDLTLAAQSVGETSRGNCGSCHFGAGGGDNVKLGDMGSALRNPTQETDVHMGAGTTCSNCHAGEDEEGEFNHTILGQGVHLPVTEGDLACADCHTTSPHDSAVFNEHALDIACQTCHIPTYSRSQATKMDWDWSTAGNRNIGDNGISTTTLPDGTVVQDYNYMKGNFVWDIDVTPEYAWYDGRVTRMTISDTYEAGQGTEENPIALGGPVATHADADALIAPFKIMRGRQPVHTADRYLIVPHLFGSGGFWPGIPTAEDYTPEFVQALWTTSLTSGARQAGQIGTEDSYVDADWSWGYTQMYLGINHEVAPADSALGADNSCSDCHSDTGVLDWEALGYTCDPMTGGAVACGSRNP